MSNIIEEHKVFGWLFTILRESDGTYTLSRISAYDERPLLQKHFKSVLDARIMMDRMINHAIDAYIESFYQELMWE